MKAKRGDVILRDMMTPWAVRFDHHLTEGIDTLKTHKYKFYLRGGFPPSPKQSKRKAVNVIVVRSRGALPDRRTCPVAAGIPAALAGGQPRCRELLSQPHAVLHRNPVPCTPLAPLPCSPPCFPLVIGLPQEGIHCQADTD